MRSSRRCARDIYPPRLPKSTKVYQGMLPKRVSIVRRNRLEGGSDPDSALDLDQFANRPGANNYCGRSERGADHQTPCRSGAGDGRARLGGKIRHGRSWRRSSNFHRLDPAECNLPRRLSQAEFEFGAAADRAAGPGCAIQPRPAVSRGRRRRLLRAACRPQRRAGRPAWRGWRRRDLQFLGPVDRRRSGAKRAKAPTASAPALSSSAR